MPSLFQEKLTSSLIPTKVASELSGYNADYLGRLCREKKIIGEQLGRSWLIDRASLESFVAGQEDKKKVRSEELRAQRGREYRRAQKPVQSTLSKTLEKTAAMRDIVARSLAMGVATSRDHADALTRSARRAVRAAHTPSYQTTHSPRLAAFAVALAVVSASAYASVDSHIVTAFTSVPRAAVRIASNMTPALIRSSPLRSTEADAPKDLAQSIPSVPTTRDVSRAIALSMPNANVAFVAVRDLTDAARTPHADADVATTAADRIAFVSSIAHHPAESFIRVYVITGESLFDIGANIENAYLASIESTGDRALTRAATLRDGIALLPRASNKIVDAYVNGIYTWNDTASKAPSTAMLAMYTVGDSISLHTAAAPVIALRAQEEHELAAVETANRGAVMLAGATSKSLASNPQSGAQSSGIRTEERAAAATVAPISSVLSDPFTRAYAKAVEVGGAVLSLPLQAENTMLGMAGYAASVLNGGIVPVAHAPSDTFALSASSTLAVASSTLAATQPQVALAQESDSHSLPSVASSAVSAPAPVDSKNLSASAISFLPTSVQQKIGDFFHSTGTLAGAFLTSAFHSTANLLPGGTVITPTLTVLHSGSTNTLALPIPANVTTDTSDIVYSGNRTIVQNIVQNYFPSALGGNAFNDAVLAIMRPYVNDSIRASRKNNRDVIVSSSGSAGTGDVNSDGATLTNVTISSGTASLSSLTVTGTTNLSTTTVTGNLTVTGTLSVGTLSVSNLSSNSAIIAPYFTATSTTATSTFPNLSTTNLTIAGSSFTSLLGFGLTNIGGILSVSTTSFSGPGSTFNADLLDGYDSSYLLANSFSTSSANNWFSNQTTDALAEGTTNLYFTNARARNALSVSGSGLSYASTTGIISVASGYSIPLTASTTDWNTAYLSRITSANTPLSISSNTISISQAGPTTNGYLSSADWNSFNSRISTTSLGLFDKGYFFSTTSTNYWLTTKTTDNLAEGSTNLYFTNARARNAISTTATGITYSSSTGVLSLTSGYGIPLTASSTDWNTAYLNRIASVTGPLTFSNNVLSIPQANGSQNGYLSSTDFNTFNGKQSALTFTYPLVNTSSTVSLAFGTTTSNTWAGTQTFTNAPILGSLTGFIKASSGVLSTSLIDLSTDVSSTLPVARGGTGSTTLTGLLKGNGTSPLLTAIDGTDYISPASYGSSFYTYFNATTTDALAEGATNLYFTNARATTNFVSNLSATTSVKSITTLSSLSLPLSQTTGVLAQNKGGTSFSTYTAGDILYADNSGNLAKLPVGGAGTVLKVQGGLPSWGVDQTVGGGGSDGIFATSSGKIYPLDTSSVVLIGTSATSSLNSIFEVNGLSYFSNKVGIGSTSPSQMLSVQGNGLISGTMTANGFIDTSATPGTLAYFDSNRQLVAATISSPLTFTGGALGIQTASGSQAGALSSTDYNTFNNKISSTSLSGAYPVQYNSSSGVISLAFGTTTANTWSALQTYNGGVKIGSLSGVLYGNSGTVAAVGTSTPTLGTGLTYSGTLGSFVGGVSGTLSISTSTVSGSGSNFNADFLDSLDSTYFLANSFSTTSANFWLTGKSTTNLAEGSNLYYTDTRARAAISNTATGLSYNNSTGVLSLTAGYTIPLTASTTDWNTAYLNRITSATAPLSITNNVLSIAQAGTASDGYLSSSDWNSFNSRISTSSLGLFDKGYFFSTTSASYFLTQNQGNAYSTTSANYWLTTKTTDNLTEGSTNLYWTNNRFDNRLSATTTLPNITTLANLGTVKTSLTGILKATSGVLSTAVAGTDYENPLTFTYPLVRTTNTVSLAFGTTTANTWSALQTFSSGINVGGSTFTSLLGTGLTNVAGTLTVSTSSFSGPGSNFNADLLDGLDSTYFLANSYSTTSANYWLTTKSTTNLAEGTNLYYTDTRARAALSSTATGLTYTAGTGVLSLTAGYSIPLTASTTDWNTAYLNRITSATAPLNITSNVLSIAQSGTGANGYLSSTDFTTFNNKISSTSLSAIGPLAYNSSTGVFSLGTVGVANGGTGSTTLTGILLGNGTGAVQTLGIGSGLSLSSGVLSASISTSSLALDSQYFKQNGNAFGGLATLGTTDSNALRFVTNGTERGRFDTAGNFGIGTTSPFATLSVAGDIALTGGIYANGTRGTNGQILQTTGTGVQWVSTTTLGFNVTTGSSILAGNGSGGFSNVLISGPITYSGGFLGILQSNGSQSGYLSVADYATFNNKISSTSLSAGTGISYNSSTGVIANTGVTSFSQTYGSAQTGAITIASSTTGTDFSITNSGSAFTFNLPTASATARGLLSSTDFTTFNSKQAALTFTYPLVNTSNTVSLAFGTTTANTWSALQTFNGGITVTGNTTLANATSSNEFSGRLTANTAAFGQTASTTISSTGALATPSLTIGTFAGVLYGNAGLVASAATSTPTLGSEFSYSGTLGSFVGGASGSLSITANGVALSKLAQIGANTILGNPTGATGNVQAFATSSLGIALSDTTGILSIARGGTNNTGFISGGVVYFDGSRINTAPGFIFNGTDFTFPTPGNFGIGTTSPYARLSVGGNVVIGASSAGGTNGSLTINALATPAGSFIAVDATGKIIATTTPVTSIAQTYGTAQNGAIIFATSSATTFNGLTVSHTITNSGGAFTFGTPTITGTLGVGGGGTGLSSTPSYGQILVGNGTGYTLTATSSLGLGTVTSVNASGGTTGLSFSGGPVTSSGTFTLAGTLGAANGGTGSTTLSGILLGNGTSAVQTLGIGSGLSLSSGVLSSNVSTTSLTLDSQYFKQNGNSFGGLATLGTTDSNALRFVTNNAEAARFDTAGNFGIGTTSPWAQLSINSNGIAGPAFVIGSSSATNFVVTNAGKVGIGTTTPVATLGIQGSLGVNASQLYLAADGSVGISSSTPGANLSVGSSGNGQVNSSVFMVQGGRIGSGASGNGQGIVLNGGGAAGIGTFTGGGISLTSGNSGATSGFGGTISLTTGSGASGYGSILLAQNGGNVGVGTSSPYAKLSVVGQTVGEYFTATSTSATSTLPNLLATNLRLSGLLYDGSNSAGTNGYVLQTTGTGVQWVATSSLGISGGNTTTGSSILAGNGSGGFTNVLISGPITYSGGFLGILQSNGSQSGYLSVADYNTFNNKISSTSLSATYPVQYNSSTGVISLAFGTTTANTWSALQTFNGGITTSGPVTLGSLSGVLYGNSGLVTSVATSTPTLDISLSYSGTLGSFVGGTSGTLSVATSSLYTGTTGQVAYFNGTNSLTGTSSINISTGGLVGIGTTSPGAKLQVAANNTGLAPQFAITGSTNAAQALTLAYNTTSGYASLNSYSNLYTFVSSALVLNNSGGNVGVGTTSPYAKFAVTGDIALTGGIYDNNATRGTSGMVLQTTGTGVQWVATSTLGIGGGGVTSVNASGGTTGLSFSGGPVTSTGTLTLAGTLGVANGGTGSTTLSGILLGNGASAVQTLGIGSGLSLSSGILSSIVSTSTLSLDSQYFRQNGNAFGGLATLGTTDSNALRFVTGGSERARFDTSGNFGIGTTSPYAKLSIQANNGETNSTLFAVGSSTASTNKALLEVKATGVLNLRSTYAEADDFSVINLYDAGGVQRFSQKSSGVPVWSFGAAGSNYITYTTPGGNPSIYFNYLGDSSTINVNGISSVNGYTINTNALTLTSNGNYILNVGGSERMRVLSSNGNVGVGTTTPNYTFSIAGSLGLTGALYDSTYSAGTSGMVLQTTGTGVQWAATSSLGISGGGGGSGTVSSGTTGQFPYYAANGTTLTATSSIFLASSGNVGFGTTSPSGKLAVSGDVFTNNIIPNGTYTNNLSAYSLGNTGARWNAIWTGTLNVGTSTFSLSSDSASNLGFYTAASAGGTQAMTITQAGNVGIGTTSPWAQLSVNPNGISGPSFAIGSSTSTSLVVTNGGLVGVGLGAPAASLDVYSNATTVGFNLAGSNTLGTTTSLTTATNASNILSVLGTNGQNSAVVGSGAYKGGLGSGISLTTGNGGDINDTSSSVSSNHRGGIGGTLALTAGLGGNSYGASGGGKGGSGGSVNLVAGNGGTSVNAIGGAGGGVGIAGGWGGNTSAAGTVAATGGSIALTAGLGGSQLAGTGTGGNGGNVTIDAGSAGSGPSYGVGGNVNIGTTNATNVTIGNIGGSTVLNLYSGTGSIAINAPLFTIQGGANSKTGFGTSTPWGQVSISPPNGLTGPSFVIGSTSAADFIVTNGRNVGVGTSSPYAKFAVAGDIALTGGLYDNNATRGTNGMVLQTTGTGVQWVATSSLGISGGGGGSGTVGSGTTGQFPYYAGSGTTLTATSTIFLASSGNLGIGTTSPYAKLSVAGDLVLGAAAAGGTPGDLYLPKLGIASGKFLAVDASGKVIATTSPSGGGTNYFTNSGINTYLSTGTRLGIGSTTPGAALSVKSVDGVGGDAAAALLVYGGAGDAVTFGSAGGRLGLYGGQGGLGGNGGTIQIIAGRGGQGDSETNGAPGGDLTLQAGGGAPDVGGSGGSNGGNVYVVGGGISGSYTQGNVLLAVNTVGDGIGRVGIGTTTPTAQLTTTGTVRFAGFGAGTLTTDANGNVTASSDERLKDISGGFTRGLADLEKLSPILYHWNALSKLDQTTQYAGFSAQNVQSAIPEAVDTDPRGYLTLQDRPILAASVNAIKELAGRTDTLSLATTTLSGRIQLLSDTFAQNQASSTMPHALSATNVTANSITIAHGVSAGTLTAQSANVDGTVSAARYVVPQVASVFSFGSSTISMRVPQEAFAGSGTVDLYKLAGYASAGVDELAARTELLDVKLNDITTRLAALEALHAATSTDATTNAEGALGLAMTTVSDALKGLGIIVHKGYLALDSLVTHQLFLVKGDDGTSSTGSEVIPAGATELHVSNPLVHPSSKIFLTFTSSVNGSWYLSKKEEGTFTITLAQAQSSDTEFDYFLLQTDKNAQIAAVGETQPPAGTPEASVTPAPVSEDGGPVVSLNGSAAIQMPQGASWTDPGAHATAADGTDLTGSLTISGSVDGNTAGLYTMTYSVTDAAGKHGQASRVVMVLSPVSAPPSGDTGGSDGTVTQAPSDGGTGTGSGGSDGGTVSAAPDGTPAS